MLYGRPAGACRINLFINLNKLNIWLGITGNIMGKVCSCTTMTLGYYNTSYNIYVYTNAT